MDKGKEQFKLGLWVPSHLHPFQDVGHNDLKLKRFISFI